MHRANSIVNFTQRRDTAVCRKRAVCSCVNASSAVQLVRTKPVAQHFDSLIRMSHQHVEHKHKILLVSFAIATSAMSRRGEMSTTRPLCALRRSCKNSAGTPLVPQNCNKRNLGARSTS
jgi:hypothetical protein